MIRINNLLDDSLRFHCIFIIMEKISQFYQLNNTIRIYNLFTDMIPCFNNVHIIFWSIDVGMSLLMCFHGKISLKIVWKSEIE